MASDAGCAVLPLPDGRRLSLQLAQQEENAGTGGELWCAHRALCNWLETVDLAGKRVLELGAGTGACGLFAVAACGASHVVLTDEVPRVLELARGNAARNAALMPTSAAVDVEPLAWGAPEAPRGPWDWVIGSDLTYSAKGTELLCQTIHQLLARAADEGAERAFSPPRLGRFG